MCCDQNQPVIDYSCWPAALSYVTIELLHCAHHAMPVTTKDNQLDKCSDMHMFMAQKLLQVGDPSLLSLQA